MYLVGVVSGISAGLISVDFHADFYWNTPGGGTPYVMGDTYVPRFWPPFLTLAGSSTIFLGYFFSSTNSKAIFWGTKTTNFYKNRSFWPHLFGPRGNTSPGGHCWDYHGTLSSMSSYCTSVQNWVPPDEVNQICRYTIFSWITVFCRDKMAATFQTTAGADQATSHYLNQWLLVYWRIYVSLGLNELMIGCQFCSPSNGCQDNITVLVVNYGISNTTVLEIPSLPLRQRHVLWYGNHFILVVIPGQGLTNLKFSLAQHPKFYIFQYRLLWNMF